MDLHGSLRALAALAALLGIAGGAGCAVGGSSGPRAGPSEAANASTATASTATASTATAPAAPAQVARRVGSVVPEPPTAIRLPGGSRLVVRTVGTTHNGVLDVPADVDEAGWWSGGSRLGDPFGSTLVAAHVDSRSQGLGPFAALLTARAGDRVELWSKGLRQTFEITQRRLRPRGTIGARAWLHSPHGPPRLTLVTCAGPYDPARGGYQNLAVVIAEPVDRVRSRS